MIIKNKDQLLNKELSMKYLNPLRILKRNFINYKRNLLLKVQINNNKIIRKIKLRMIKIKLKK